MPIKEKVTDQKAILLINKAITSDKTTYSEILDTADYDDGVYFIFQIVAWDNTAADCACTVQHGDDSGMCDAEAVSSDMLVYGDDITLDDGNTASDSLIREGVHSTKRYLRIKAVTTGIDTSLKLNVIAIVNPEVVPTTQS